MTDKYIVTVETNQGREKACKIGEQQLETGGTYPFEVTSLDAARSFVGYNKGLFPFAKYRIYKLEEVNDS